MTKQQQKKYLEKLKALIEFASDLEKLEKPTKDPNIKTIQDGEKLQSWLIQVENALQIIFGKEGPHYQKFEELKKKKTYYASSVREIKGLLFGALKDLEDGFIVNLEFLLLAESFDNMLEEAEELASKNFLRAACIYCRVIIENSLKKLAYRHNIKPKQKVSILNIELKNKRVFDVILHNKIAKWLDLCNNAAHQRNLNRKKEEVENLLSEVKSFVEEKVRKKTND